MKTRRVIGTAKVTCPCKQLRYDERILNGLACAQEVELAVYEDVPPKRKLVVPEGIKWITSMVYPERERLIHNDKEIAMVQRDGRWCIAFDDIKHARSIEEGKQACIEAMATASINGFYWEESEPPAERIVLPEGMKWDIAELLWTADGTLIASARCGNAWYCVPFMLLKITIDSCANREDTKRAIETALAEHGYFGVKKVVDNE